MSNDKRILWPDISKGIGILMVVFFHSILPGLRTTFAVKAVFNLLQETHMPLFFFLSGWLFELKADRTVQHRGRALWNRFLRLMVPYFVFTLIYYTATNLALMIPSIESLLTMSNGGYAHYSLLESLYQIFTFDGHMAESLWFLYALFLISVVNILMPRLTRHPAFVAAIIPLCMVPRFFPDFFHTFKILSLVLYYLFYFSLARALFPRTDRLFCMKKPTYLAVVLGYLATSFATVIVLEMNVWHLPNDVAHHLYPIVRQVAAVFGIFVICTFAQYISQTKAAKPLGFLGRKSMVIYLIHAPILTQAATALTARLLPKLPLIIYFLTGTAVGISVPLLLDWLVISRVPLLNTILTGAPYRQKSAGGRSLPPI